MNTSAPLELPVGLSTVDYGKCTGCGACSKACPRNLIRMVPFGQENMMVVACSSRENGRNTRAFCQVGCIGCGLCVKQSGAFKVEDNLAQMGYAKYEASGRNEAAYNKGPTGVTVHRDKSAPDILSGTLVSDILRFVPGKVSDYVSWRAVWRLRFPGMACPYG